METLTIKQENETKDEQIRRLHGDGLRNPEIARIVGVTRQRVAQVVGFQENKFRLESDPINVTITITAEARDNAREVAKGLGLTNLTGSIPGQGSLNQLVEGIGRGFLEVVPKAKVKIRRVV